MKCVKIYPFGMQLCQNFTRIGAHLLNRVPGPETPRSPPKIQKFGVISAPPLPIISPVIPSYPYCHGLLLLARAWYPMGLGLFLGRWHLGTRFEIVWYWRIHVGGLVDGHGLL